jgi:predicted transposase YdaD
MDLITTPNIITPHNNFFVRVMSRKEKAIAFSQKFLPKDILEIADLKKMQLVESRHMSDAGRSLYNDILYRCPLGKGQYGYFFFVCEHQSKPDPKMPLRLMEYDVATIKDHLDQGHKKIPVLVNTVFHTGKRPWNYSTAFSDYYANPSLGSKYLYMAPFNLVQLPANDDKEEKIYTDKDLGFCFAAFYCGRNKDAYREFEKFKQVPVFQKYFDKLPADERELIGIYIALCVDRSRYSLEKIVNLIIINEQEKNKFMQSVAQEYIEQGIRQGIRQGMQQGIQTRNLEIARAMLLNLHLDADTVRKATDLTKEEIQELLKGANNTSN